MSTNPKPTTESHSRTTEIAARGRADPWASPDEGSTPPPTQRAQRQFEPTAHERLRNLTDCENAYCN